MMNMVVIDYVVFVYFLMIDLILIGVLDFKWQIGDEVILVDFRWMDFE